MKTQEMIKEFVAEHYGNCEVIYSKTHKGIGSFMLIGGAGFIGPSMRIYVVYRSAEGYISAQSIYGADWRIIGGLHQELPELHVEVEETMQYGDDYRITVCFGKNPSQKPRVDLPKSLFLNDSKSLIDGD